MRRALRNHTKEGEDAKNEERRRLCNAALEYNDPESRFYQKATEAARHFGSTSKNACAAVKYYAGLSYTPEGMGAPENKQNPACVVTAERAAGPEITEAPKKRTKATIREKLTPKRKQSGESNTHVSSLFSQMNSLPNTRQLMKKLESVMLLAKRRALLSKS